jgi:hypothetical protein
MTENVRKRKIAEMEARDVMDVREDASRYLRARLILSDLREKYTQGKINWHQYSTMRGQALAGDIDGAVKGLARVLRQRWEGEA